jgi:hypothetical protein
MLAAPTSVAPSDRKRLRRETVFASRRLARSTIES